MSQVKTQRLTRLQKQAALAALKKPLLHQAFTGELRHRRCDIFVEHEP
jgi:hypothetical protein